MEVKAIHRFARISPQKAREVAREIQGMDVSSALAVLNYTPRKAALLIGKALQSAIANASHNHDLDEETLFVKSAIATTGPSLKRIMPRARGSAAPIKKRMAHITVVVSNERNDKSKTDLSALIKEGKTGISSKRVRTAKVKQQS